MDSIHGLCAANLILTKLNSSNLHVKLIQLILLTNCVITHTEHIKDFEVVFGTTFFFDSLKMLGLVRTYESGMRLFFFDPERWRI